MKNGTSPKTLRIPNNTISDIERVAKEKKTSFSKEANRRLANKGGNDINYPYFLAKMQTIINLCGEGVATGREEPIRKAQEEEKKIWTEIMTSSK